MRALTPADRAAWLSMRQALWMGSDATTRGAEDGSLLIDPQRYGARRYAVLVALANGVARGFVEVSLRDDLGTTGGAPAGYIEGIYVEPRHAKHGLGRALMAAAEAWCLDAGAADLVADVLDDNPEGLAFHAASGFARVDSTASGDHRQMRLRKTLT